MHVVFKTHLDVGFTDFADAVKRRYFDQYIPLAIQTARGLRSEGGTDRFIWTTGSWILYEYLEQADREHRSMAEEAIHAGDLRWHGLPFTTHTELMDPELFRFGLGLSAALDRRFGVRTIAAKMTDVPGHTRGIVPLLADSGIRFLHIGVNSACHPPAVPELFRWREPETGSEVLVMYHAGYGDVTIPDGLDAGLAIQHTDDNLGPQTRDEVIRTLERLRHRYPDHEIRASTLDAFAAELDRLRPKLPVVGEEIGDTWIYGTASDPRMTTGLRALLELRRRWLREPALPAPQEALDRFSRELLLIAEHTWGLDQKTCLGDYRCYRKADFERARARDTVAQDIPERFAFAEPYARRGPIRSYRVMEASWLDHRAHLDRAVAALGDTPPAAAAARALKGCAPTATTPERWRPAAELDRAFELPGFAVRFGPDGSLVELREKRTGLAWASRDRRLAWVRYQTFSRSDYDRFLRGYMARWDDPEIHSWAAPDFDRLGLGPGDSVSAFFSPRVVGFARHGARFVLDLRFPERPRSRYGCPRTLRLAYRFGAGEVRIEVCWLEKPATRLPEATWVSFRPVVPDPDLWEIEKMGRWISPLTVVSRGGRTLHGIGTGARIRREPTTLLVESRDAHLVSPGSPRLLVFDDTLPVLDGGMHFCLHANLFGTNFPLWYGEDARFRFRLRFGGGPGAGTAGSPGSHRGPG